MQIKRKNYTNIVDYLIYWFVLYHNIFASKIVLCKNASLKFWKYLIWFLRNCWKNLFLAARSRIFQPIFFIIQRLPLKMCHLNFVNISISSRFIDKKTGFRRPFWIFTTKPEIDFLNQYFLLITTIEADNLPLEFCKYLN